MGKQDGTAVGLPAGETLPARVRSSLFQALEQGPQAVALFDAQDHLAYANDAFRIGWAVANPARATFGSIMRSCHIRGEGAIVEAESIEDWLVKAHERRRHGPPFRAFEVDLRDGRWMWITERRLDDGWILLIGQDISPLKISEQTMRAARDTAVTASLTDPLTQLANRRKAIHRIDELVAQNKTFFLALIDIDHFKRINDTFGHAAGDEALVAVADKLRILSGGPSLPARLAGDEFALLSAPDESKEGFERLLHGLTEGLNQSVRWSTGPLPLTLSIGIAQSPADGQSAGELLAAADAAMYAAKTEGRARWHYHRPAMGAKRREEAELHRDLESAFSHGEFVPYLQPIVDIGTRRIRKFEVLARWDHPRLGVLPPDRFLNLMSSGQELTRLTNALLSNTVQSAWDWPDHLSFAFNIAATQLTRDELLPMLEQVCASGGIAPDRFEMEITEAALLHDTQKAKGVVEAVRELGMSVALDDFGIGFSSLHHLREIRFDCVKIDRSFLAGVEQSRNRRYLAALVHLVKELDLTVTVEGIETAELEAVVAELGCDFGQGYFYGRPRPALEVEASLATAGRQRGPAIRQA